LPRVTGLRKVRAGQVAVEVDGVRWRVVPVEVAVRAGLDVGLELDRTRARTLRRELRRADAVSRAARSLRTRDLTAQRVRERLERGGVAPAVRDEAVAALERAGLVDDRRLAVARATALAVRGYGDAAIRYDLDRRGVAEELASDVVAALEPELARAERFAEGRNGKAAARLLSRRGFADETVEAVVRPDVAPDV
jgi:SOS response regulatory protein OraA/RecX